MLNYDALHALAMVAREKSFARAARALHLTQPAVSQRIRLLEDELGELLLARGQPPRLTALGARLVQHLQQVQQLEGELGVASDGEVASGPAPTLAIGVNADSLGTWLLDVLSPWVKKRHLRLEVLVEDEDYSFELLRQGQVVGAISSRERALQGCCVEKLGTLEYLCVASREFQRQRWAASEGLKQLAQLPCIAFGRKDDLQEVFLDRKCGVTRAELQPHYIASNAGYLGAVLHGWGWGLVVRQQAASLLKTRRLVDLAPGTSLAVPLYWHQWRITSVVGKELERLLVAGAKAAL